MKKSDLARDIVFLEEKLEKLTAQVKDENVGRLIERVANLEAGLAKFSKRTNEAPWKDTLVRRITALEQGPRLDGEGEPCHI